MKRRIKGIAASAVALAMAGTMIVPASTVFAAQNGTTIMQPQNQQFGGGGQGNFGQNNSGQGNFGQNNFGGNGFGQNTQQGMMNQNVTYASNPGTIATSTVENTAAKLTENTANATTITMSEDNSQVKITESGTYIVTGKCSDGNITVKKGTTGVVLILKDLDLTSTTGATVSINKNAEAKIIIQGTVKLTDNENPDDENSTDSEVADAYDGAALKAKDGSNVYLAGDGTLTIAGNAKNGIKIGDEDTPSFVIGGNLKLNITAANDGINAGYDLTILSGTVNVSAADDGIHADRILTIGSESTSPTVTVTKSTEALEGTVVNIFGGTIDVTASDDGVNAANKEGTYSSELAFSVNITGGTTTISAGTDGIDSNGNINITGGKVIIKKSASNGGDAGIDYDGAFYLYDTSALTNSNGVSGPDGGGMGQMPGQQGQWGQQGQQNQQGQQGQWGRQDQQGQWGRQGQSNQQGQWGQQDQQDQQDQWGQQGQRGQQGQQDQQDQQEQPAQQEQQQDQAEVEASQESAQQEADSSESAVTTKTKNLKYAKLVCTYTDGKLTKVVVKAKTGAKVTIKKDGTTYSKTTLTKAGKYTITAKKKVGGKWKKQTKTITIQ